MAKTQTKVDVRIITALKVLVDKIAPRDAEVLYEGASAHPLTGAHVYKIGFVAGARRTYEDLTRFLGQEGYISWLTWRSPESDYMSLGIHHGNGALSITNGSRRDPSHVIGLRGAKSMPEDNTPVGDDPNRVYYHILDSEEEVVRLALELLEI